MTVRRLALLLVLSSAGAAAAQSPPVVAMQVETDKPRPISRFIYGLNWAELSRVWGSKVPRGITLNRFGGNRTSAWDWETNASNCGNDCGEAFPNDAYLGGSGPGGAVKPGADWAFARQAGFLATVPMLGWVAADTAGPVSLKLPLGERRAKRFKLSRARKGAPLAAGPDTTDKVTNQDEFVAWLERTYPFARKDPLRPIFYSLDNEPDLWGSTHEEVRGNRLAKDKYVLTGYDELVQRSIEYASAIKDAAPGALVFGPALSGWNGYQNLFHNDAPDPAGRQFFLAYYLERMHQAGQAQGRRLLDVLDVHFYSQVQSANHQSVANEWAKQDSAMIQARVQAPRSLWDPTYRERSWIMRVVDGPLRLLPRLRDLVARHAPGTRIAITEYSYYRGGDISGGIAQADALGIFGREGVFAATLWPQGAIWAYKGDVDKTYACVMAAFRVYRDYDGQGATFGDLSLPASTVDVERTSLYASADSGDPGRLVLVVINKTEAPIGAEISLPGGATGGEAQVWQLTGGVGGCTGPARVAPDVPVVGGTLVLRLPPLSVSTVALRR
jgi:Glycoside hydrolase family 44